MKSEFIRPGFSCTSGRPVFRNYLSSVCPQIVLGSRCSLLAVKLALDTTSTVWLLCFLLGMMKEFIFICWTLKAF